MATLYIAYNKVDPRVCITHFSNNSILAIIEILAANQLDKSRYNLTAEEKEKYKNLFEFTQVMIED